MLDLLTYTLLALLPPVMIGRGVLYLVRPPFHRVQELREPRRKTMRKRRAVFGGAALPEVSDATFLRRRGLEYIGLGVAMIPLVLLFLLSWLDSP
ncbi:MAG: hypothetical protein WBV82_20455 [Myxococcaceae bacterium]